MDALVRVAFIARPGRGWDSFKIYLKVLPPKGKNKTHVHKQDQMSIPSFFGAGINRVKIFLYVDIYNNMEEWTDMET